MEIQKNATTTTVITVSPSGTIRQKEKVMTENTQSFDWQSIRSSAVSDCDTHTKALLVLLVKKEYGLRLSFNSKQFILGHRRHKAIGGNGETLIISKDVTVAASMYWAKTVAAKKKLGIFGK